MLLRRIVSPNNGVGLLKQRDCVSLSNALRLPEQRGSSPQTTLVSPNNVPADARLMGESIFKGIHCLSGGHRLDKVSASPQTTFESDADPSGWIHPQSVSSNNALGIHVYEMY